MVIASKKHHELVDAHERIVKLTPAIYLNGRTAPNARF
jgi:hypothetical protein